MHYLSSVDVSTRLHVVNFNKEQSTPRCASCCEHNYVQSSRNVNRTQYMGSFAISSEEHSSVEKLREKLQKIKENGSSEPVLLQISVSGLKICRTNDQSVLCSAALHRVSLSTCEASRALFAFVSRSRNLALTPNDDAPPLNCHVLATDTPNQAEELNSLVGDVFRMASASQLQHVNTPPHKWCQDLPIEDQGVCIEMGVRAPNSLPGLQRHYPPDTPTSGSASSPSSAESVCGWRYRRLGGGGWRRRGRGRGEDQTPLVSDTPTTPTTHVPLSVNGGYINEGVADAEAKTRHSNLDPSIDAPSAPNETIKNERLLPDESKTQSKHRCSSSCSSGNGNNIPFLSLEPQLRNAPWFHQGIPREIACEVLRNTEAGSFIVRESSTRHNCLALSLRVPSHAQDAQHVAHYLILPTENGYKIKGFTKEFSSVTALVTHHSVMPELLPCPLKLQRNNQIRRSK